MKPLYSTSPLHQFAPVARGIRRAAVRAFSSAALVAASLLISGLAAEPARAQSSPAIAVQLPTNYYDNTVNPFTSGGNQGVFGGGFGSGNGSALSGGNFGTALVADDILFASGTAGLPVTEVRFSVFNFNGAPVQARVGLRFYNTDGAGGGPGTLIASYTEPVMTYQGTNTSMSSILLMVALNNPFNVPANGQMWAGIFFDTVGTSTTQGQIANFGQDVFNPPTIGSSNVNTAYVSNNGGDTFSTNSPAGQINTIGNGFPSNFAWQFGVVPEPSSFALAALGGIGLLCGARRWSRRR